MNILKIFQHLDNIISYLISNSANEKKFLRNFLNKDNIKIIDAGTNNGTYINFLEGHFKINKAYMFEPSRKAHAFLNKKFQSKKQYHLIKNGLSKNLKIVDFFEYNIISQSSMYKKKNYYNKNLKINDRYKIKCISLDYFFKKNKLKEIIDICKIDCESEDFNILKGSKTLLKNKKIKLIKIEIENNENFLNIMNFLNNYGYKLITITKKKFYKNKLLFMDAYFSHGKYL